MQNSASFWADIKNLEDQLASNPESFCFARLSEVYFKVGLIDDAIHVARQGVIKHPRYLSGQRSLALACHAKGLKSEALAALQLIAEALPEDVSSLKLLGRLYAEAGNYTDACRTFRTAVEFAPDDQECRIELESLERSQRGTSELIESNESGEDSDIDDLEELDILEDDHVDELESIVESSDVEPQLPEVASELNIVPVPHHDPLSTGTLAELYVKQGFIHKALEIYRAILADNPADSGTLDRVSQLEALEAAMPETDATSDDTFEVVADDVQCTEPISEMLVKQGESIAVIKSHDVPPVGIADNALRTLNGWLENIRRIKSCR